MLSNQSHLWHVSGLAYSKDGKFLASGGREGSALLCQADGSPIHRYEASEGEVRSLAFSPDTTRLAVGCSDHTVKVYNLHTHQCDLSFQGHRDLIESVEWSPDGASIASCDGQSVQVWDMSSGAVHLTIQREQHQFSCVQWSPNGKTLATATYDETRIVRWTLDGEKDLVYEPEETSASVFVLAYSPDGRKLLVGNDSLHGIIVLSCENQLFKEYARYTGHGEEPTSSLAYSPDCSLIASAGTFGLHIWKVVEEQETLLVESKTHSSVICSVAWADGRTLAFGDGNGTVNFYSLRA